MKLASRWLLLVALWGWCQPAPGADAPLKALSKALVEASQDVPSKPPSGAPAKPSPVPEAKLPAEAPAKAPSKLPLEAPPKAPPEPPLYEQDPFDQITLNAENKHEVLKVQPLNLPDRRKPENPKAADKITVRLLEQPEKPYEVQWIDILKVEYFDEMVRDKALALVTEGKLDQAYDHLKFLEERYPATPGLNEALAEYLFAEARVAASHDKADYTMALAMLREAYQRHPKRPALEKALGITTEKLVERYVAKEKHAAARSLLRNLAAWFPQHPVVAKWEGQFQSQARGLLAEARQAADAGALDKASAACRGVERIWPDLPGAKELAESVFRKYPRLVVGVGEPGRGTPTGWLHDWAGRRSGRLLWRTLTEFAGPGTDGGRYRCAIGQLTVDALGRQIDIRVKPGQVWSSGDDALTGADVAWRLLAMADPRDPACRPDWAEVFLGIGVRNVYDVEVSLRRTHVRPEALLDTILTPQGQPSAGGGPAPCNGPYMMVARPGKETCYVANPHYAASESPRVKELVERPFAESADAVRALKSGQIQVLDRVAPWDLPLLRDAKDVVLEPYAVPLVHCLVPNLRKPLVGNRSFRRALVYGVHRQSILTQMLGGRPTPGCRVISGPFPPGLSEGDPLGYGCDDRIQPRAYDPYLAIALAQVGLQEVAAQTKSEAFKKMPSLVLAHCGGDVAQLACSAIQRQLKVVGIPIEVRRLPHAGRPPDDVDLVYAELAMWEPVVDARRLLGEDGLTGRCSSHMSLVLRQLDQATRWTEIRARLHQIHRIAYEETAVVPLWQMVEHYAYHAGVQGIGGRLITLYENVEQWQPELQYGLAN